MPKELTNAERADRARKTLTPDAKFLTAGLFDSAVDLLTDLRHLFASHPKYFDTAVRLSGDHFMAEREEEFRNPPEA